MNFSLKSTALLLFIIIGIFSFPQMPVHAQLVSPTPDFDGNILYTINENDSCMSISLRMGIDVETIKQMNNLDEQCSLIAGTKILLGRVVTATPTAGPSPTPTPILPTPTLYDGNAELCIYLFNDVNGNAKAESGERGIAGGAVSVTKKGGTERFTGLTTGLDRLCFDEVPEGEYNISVAPPADYNATTNMNYPITVKAGDQTQVNFGAQKQAGIDEPMVPTNQPSMKRSPILALAGIGLIAGGIVLVVIFGILKRRE